jgi:hypothetical protein
LARVWAFLGLKLALHWPFWPPFNLWRLNGLDSDYPLIFSQFGLVFNVASPRSFPCPDSNAAENAALDGTYG